MQRALDLLKGVGAAARIADVIDLDYDLRHRRRIKLRARGGLTFLLDLPTVPDLRDGDALVLEDGRLILIKAAEEPLMEISCEGSRHLARLAWHIGNRHLPAQMLEHALRIRSDHVIADMARGLGASVTSLMAPFDPEKGAYHGQGHSPNHDH